MKPLKDFRTWGLGVGFGLALWALLLVVRQSSAQIETIGGGVSAASVTNVVNASVNGIPPYLARFASTNTLTNSGFFELATNRMALGITNGNFIVNDSRVMGVGLNVITNYSGAVDVTAVGYQALKNLGSGDFLVGVGDDALGKNTTGSENTGVGSQALFENTTAREQTAVGYQALASVVASNANTGIGHRAGAALTGVGNTLVGMRAFESLEGGNANVGIGYRANVHAFGDPNASNVVVGSWSFANNQSVIIGSSIVPGEASRFLTLVGHMTDAGDHTNSAAFGWKSTVTSDNQHVYGSNVLDYMWADGAMRLFNSNLHLISTGHFYGITVTQDIRFLGHNSASNSVWVCTNATTGEGEWRTVSSVVSSTLNLTNDPHRLVLQAEPVQGSVYYTGTNGAVSTNGARGGFEFHPAKRALKMGDASGVQWNDTNTGQGSVNFGSNNIAGGRFTTIAGGVNNVTHTNVENSFIGGGSNHSISTNASASVIGGGENHQILLDCSNSFIGGGVSQTIRRAARNSTIGGGASNIATDPYNTIGGGVNNFISDESSGSVIDSTAATIAGGEESIARGLRSTIGGGYKHNLISDCNYSTISGGSSNGMGLAGAANGTQFSLIAGGSQNSIGGLSHMSVISGGQLNFIGQSAVANVIDAGVSNNIPNSVVYARVIGNFGTNSVSRTVLLSYERVKVKSPASQGASNAVVGGKIWQQVGTAFTNLNATIGTLSNLATVSIAAHQLTNVNDELEADWGIKLRIATVSSNRFQIFYGGTTLLDTGAQSCSNDSVRANCIITRTGNSTAHVEASLSWGPGTAPFAFTNANIEIPENNGIANTLGMKGSASAEGSHTNNYFRVKWSPAAQ